MPPALDEQERRIQEYERQARLLAEIRRKVPPEIEIANLRRDIEWHRDVLAAYRLGEAAIEAFWRQVDQLSPEARADFEVMRQYLGLPDSDKPAWLSPPPSEEIMREAAARLAGGAR